MAFLRNQSREKFTVIDNVAVRDDDLSLKALGLLVKLLSLPDNWEFSENGLGAIFKKDGQASIRSGLKELEKYGYLTRTKHRDSKGRITGVEWVITENPHLENPHLENPSMDKPSSGNRPQYNTDSIKDSKNESPTDKAPTEEPAEAGEADCNFFRDTYNRHCPNLAPCTTITQKRRQAIARFLRELPKERWIEVCEKAGKLAFLHGQNKSGWRADFNWLLQPDKAVSLLEGAYDDRQMDRTRHETQVSPEDIREDMAVMRRILESEKEEEGN